MRVSIEEDGFYDSDCELELKVRVKYDNEAPKMGFRGREAKEEESIIILP